MRKHTTLECIRLELIKTNNLILNRTLFQISKKGGQPKSIRTLTNREGINGKGLHRPRPGTGHRPTRPGPTENPRMVGPQTTVPLQHFACHEGDCIEQQRIQLRRGT